MGFGGDIKYNPIAALVWKNYWSRERIAARVYSGVLTIKHTQVYSGVQSTHSAIYSCAFASIV